MRRKPLSLPAGKRSGNPLCEKNACTPAMRQKDRAIPFAEKNAHPPCPAEKEIRWAEDFTHFSRMPYEKYKILLHDGSMKEKTCLLTDDEKVAACKCIMEANADFVKTSTGFSSGGATLEDVELLKKTVGDKCKVKASGGIKTQEDMLKMIALGADRIGTSSGVKLMEKAN